MAGGEFIAVDPAVIEDLRDRLVRTRFTSPSGHQSWRGGFHPGYLEELVAYWIDEYDWFAHQSKLNAFTHRRVSIADRMLHFVHMPAARGREGAQLPVLLVHGWPSSFVEMLELGQRLSDPAHFGNDPATARDVVVPSLPGFMYSDPLDGPTTRRSLARTLHSLMCDALGYPTYGAFGGDIGAGVAAWLGALFPDRVRGVHVIHPPIPAVADRLDLDAAELWYLENVERYDRSDGGYSAIMMTRPDTLAAALVDSPAGLAAWILDKYRDWSDCSGELENRFHRDTLLTIVNLYWITNSIGTSFRQYFDYAEHNVQRPIIEVPLGVTLACEPSMVGFPRSLTERACRDIRHWSEPGRGGHFLPLEEPDLMASELRAFFAGV